MRNGPYFLVSHVENTIFSFVPDLFARKLMGRTIGEAASTHMGGSKVVYLRVRFERVKMDLFTENGTPFEDVVPHHDDTGGDQLCDHVVDVGAVDEQPHEQLVEPEPRDARAEEEHLRTSRLRVCSAKDTDEAEPVVDEDGDGEGDPCREEVVEPAVLGEDVEQTVVEEETCAADEDEARDFIKSG